MSTADQAILAPLMPRVQAALARQDHASALQLLAEARRQHPEVTQLHLNSALVYRMIGDTASSLRMLDEVLARDAQNFVALLSKAALVEQSAGLRQAAQVYRAALRAAPPDPSLPPPLVPAVQRAREVVEQDSQALQEHLRADLAPIRARHAGETFNRFDESLNAFAGTGKLYPQRPLLLQYGRLPAIPFHDRAAFPWLGELEAATDMIAGELHRLIAANVGDFAPYIQYPPGAPVQQWGQLNHSLLWSSYFLWRDGLRHAEACERCPGTAALMDRLPLMRQPGRAPTVVFSVLEPHTHIPPHTGSSNTRLLVHLPLILPGPARFRVGSETRDWRMGQAWVFDDTIEHEAWNDADARRVILIIDVWNPLLREAERDLIAAMMQAKDAYYASG